VWGNPLTGLERTVLALSAAQYSIAVVMHLPLMLYFGVNLGYALLAPIAATMYAMISLDSLLRTIFGSGVSWKLREYRKPAAGSAAQR
jgi:hypothetical protein